MQSFYSSLHLMAGVNLDLDLTLFIQLGIVLVLMFVLKSLVFNPYLKAVDARGAKTTETREQADSLKSEADALAARYAESLADARTRALETKQALRAEGLKAKDEALSEAKASANATIQEAQTTIAAAVDAERPQLDAQVDALSKIVVERIIGQKA